MVRMVVGIDHIAYSPGAAFQGKRSDLLGLLGKGQSINDYCPVGCGDDHRRDFGVQTADKDINVFGDSFA
jgi:hypothetical protein